MIKSAAMIGAPDLGEETLAVYNGDPAEAFHKMASIYWETNTGIGPVLLLSAVLAVL